ncbi:hypothetical protein IEO21_08147 [Rhodonia placenta]|uniref:Uncharacterized protein n=1 Tax=Rhodonia placenta TaxID=104341 RepID=A0A8H7TZ35_9APHY|nr:hypothetical protein IEO21_08147 [Postia placenta]
MDGLHYSMCQKREVGCPAKYSNAFKRLEEHEDSLQSSIQSVFSSFRTAQPFLDGRPRRAALVVGVAVGVALTPVATTAALSAYGFGPAGPVAGTAAAAAQSAIGNVAAGSLFASCQSIAMTSVPVAAYAVGGAVGGAIGGAASFVGGHLANWF